MDDICALLGNYAAYSGKSFPTFRDRYVAPNCRKRITTARRVIFPQERRLPDDGNGNTFRNFALNSRIFQDQTTDRVQKLKYFFYKVSLLVTSLHVSQPFRLRPRVYQALCIDRTNPTDHRTWHVIPYIW